MLCFHSGTVLTARSSQIDLARSFTGYVGNAPKCTELFKKRTPSTLRNPDISRLSLSLPCRGSIDAYRCSVRL
jgi:hypothetical protein